MERRDFLKAALAGGALYSAGGLPGLGSIAYAKGFPSIDKRVLIKLMLLGGPDMRHLFPPAFDAAPASFGYNFWRAKARAHSIADSPSDWETRWQNDYFEVADGSTRFGIRNSCGWLKAQWDAGHVAIVNNAVGGKTRDHAHCIDITDQGNVRFQPNQAYGSGWGGRLADAADGNVLALTKSPRPFCYGPDIMNPQGFDNTRLIAARNTRELALYEPDVTESPIASTSMITRGLSSYYKAKRNEINPDSVFQRFVDTERKLREFGEPIDARLDSVPVPASIDALLQGGLNYPEFGEQIRNLHDCFACFDIMNLRVASMDFGSWDSHEEQVNLVEPKLSDMFATGKAFDTLFQELPADALENTVLVIAGEFGRQLRANGDNGTDHGEGNSVVLIGNSVNGGVYGDMFPDAELARLRDPSPQITGLTAFDHVFGRVCDWVEPASDALVFPDRALAEIEPGLDLSALLI